MITYGYAIQVVFFYQIFGLNFFNFHLHFQDQLKERTYIHTPGIDGGLLTIAA